MEAPRMPPAVNYHVLAACNYQCKGCYAAFAGVHGWLGLERARDVITRLREAGVEKLTLAGGEPTLLPDLDALVAHAKAVGLTTSVVTNATGLDEARLAALAPALDWLAVSIDSFDDAVEADFGRGTGAHVAHATAMLRAAKRLGIRTKLNTIVMRTNWREDMAQRVRELDVDRWKVLRLLPVEGENDAHYAAYAVTTEQFRAFVARNARAITVAEDHDDMYGSYAMVDPWGRFFQNDAGRVRYGRPILQVGAQASLADVGWNEARFLGRGGAYAWAKG